MKYFLNSVCCIFFLFNSCILLFAQPHVRPDNKINKAELELAFFGGFSKREITRGVQLSYRFPLACHFKAGAGFHLSEDDYKGGAHPALFVEVLKFTGNKRKWCFAAQFGKGFYTTKSDAYGGINGSTFVTSENRERMLQLSSSYRMNISRKIIVVVGGYFLNQSYRTLTEITDGSGQPINPFPGRSNYGGGGVRAGIIF